MDKLTDSPIQADEVELDPALPDGQPARAMAPPHTATDVVDDVPGEPLESTDADEPAERVKPWEAFKIRNFRYLWGNSFAFAMIQSSEKLAFTWLMLELYDQSSEAGKLAFVAGIPILLFGIPAGGLADRFNRRNLLMSTQLAAAGVTGAITFMLWTDTLTYAATFILAFLLGTTLALGSPVRMSTIPTIVPRKTLMNAIVLNGFAQNISIVAGPALAGIMYGQFGVKGAFLTFTIFYLLAFLVLIPLDIPPRAGNQDEQPKRGVAQIVEGFRFILGHAGIRGMFMFLCVAAIFLMGPYQVMVPVVAKVKLGVTVEQASLMFSALGIGTFISTTIQASMGDIKRKGAAFLVTCSLCGTMLASVGLSNSYPLTLVLMVFWGIIGGFFMNLIQALIQSNTPDEYLGRVAGVQTVIMQGLSPIGALIAGVGADALDVTPWMLLCGGCMIGSAVLISITQPAFRRM